MFNITSHFLGKLPPGFEVYEEEDFVYLYFNKERVAIFSSRRVEPEVIVQEAKKYLESRGFSSYPEE
ncbi:MAG: hypothetical protein AB7D02_01640 [Candidatus Paceibacterota bacterium]